MKKRNKNPFKVSYVFALTAKISKNKKFLFACITLVLLSLVEGVALPFIDEFIVGEIFPGLLENTFFWILILIFIVKMVTATAKFLKEYFIGSFGYEILKQTKNDIFEKLSRENLQFFEKSSKGSLLLRMTAFAEEIATFYTNIVFDFIEILFTLILLLPFMFFSVPIFATITLALVVPLLLVLEFIRMFFAKSIINFKIAKEKQTEKLIETMVNVQTINFYGQKNTVLDENTKTVKIAGKIEQKSKILEGLFSLVQSVFYLLSIVIVLCLTFPMIQAEEIALAKYVQFQTYQAQFWVLMACLSGLLKTLTEFDSETRIMFKTFEMENVVEKSKNLGEHMFKGNIEIKNLSFSFGKKIIISELSVYIESGQNVGISGKMNSGKTTLALLLSKLLKTKSDTIFFDGTDVNEIDGENVAVNVVVEPNTPYFVQGTLFENIVLGNPNVTKEEAQKVLKLLGIWHVVQQMGGLAKEISVEEIENLSDGFKALLMGARVLVRNSPIMIFDNTFECLGGEVEAEMCDAICDNYVNNTILFVTDNPKVLKKMNKVVELK